MHDDSDDGDEDQGYLLVQIADLYSRQQQAGKARALRKLAAHPYRKRVTYTYIRW